MNCNSDKEGNCDSNEGGRQAMATAMTTKRVMATATMEAVNKEGNCDGGKSNGDGDEGGGQAN